MPLVVSGRGAAALRAQAAQLASFVDDNAVSLVDVGTALVTSRAMLSDRAVVLAADTAEAVAGLRGLADGAATLSGVADVEVGVQPGTGESCAGRVLGPRQHPVPTPGERHHEGGQEVGLGMVERDGLRQPFVGLLRPDPARERLGPQVDVVQADQRVRQNRVQLSARGAGEGVEVGAATEPVERGQQVLLGARGLPASGGNGTVVDVRGLVEHDTTSTLLARG